MALALASSGHYKFPPEFISPDDKESNEYGLQYAKAIYHCGNRYGGFPYNGLNNQYDKATELAQGNPSVVDIYRMFGYGPTDPNDVTREFAHVDVRVLNLATKYINRVVDKMCRLHYDVSLQAVDIVSINEKADYAASLQAFYSLRKWTQEMGYNPQVLFPDLDVASLPMYPDELLYDIATNPKIKKEISGELLMKLIYESNNMKQQMRQVAWDLAVYGKAHLHCYEDPNGMPRIDQINGKFWGGSYVQNEDHEKQEYAFFYDFISVNQFIKETSGQLSQDKQMDICEQYASEGTLDLATDYRRLENYDGLAYIPVMRFYFLSEDNRTFVKKKNGFGRPILDEKDFNYQIPDIIREKFDNKEYSRIDTCYTSVYGGTYVIDSDCVYSYKRQDYPRQNLVNATIPIKTFATNYKEGRYVSFLAQMEEPLNMINVAWNRIKQILAEERMGTMEIDFDQIEAVALTSGGKQWTATDVMRLFFKKRILIKRGKTNKFDQKVMNAIEQNTGGLTFSDYLESMRLGIQMLEEMTATSLAERVDTPDRLAVKNAQMSQVTSDIDLGYLYNGYDYLYQRASHQMMLIAQGSLRKGNLIAGPLRSAIGNVNLGWFQAPRELAYTEYGMYFTRQPTPEEWRDFYLDLQIELKEGRISAADSAFIREIDNMKQARQILGIRGEMYRRRLMEEQQRTAELQMQANSQAAAENLQGQVAIMREKAMIDANLIRLEGEIKRGLQDEKEQWASSRKREENQNKKVIAKQTSNSELLKKSIENIPEKEKNLLNNITDQQKIEVEREKVQVMKNKPATASK